MSPHWPQSGASARPLKRYRILFRSSRCSGSLLPRKVRPEGVSGDMISSYPKAKTVAKRVAPRLRALLVGQSHQILLLGTVEASQARYRRPRQSPGLHQQFRRGERQFILPAIDRRANLLQGPQEAAPCSAFADGGALGVEGLLSPCEHRRRLTSI